MIMHVKLPNKYFVMHVKHRHTLPYAPDNEALACELPADIPVVAADWL